MNMQNRFTFFLIALASMLYLCPSNAFAQADELIVVPGVFTANVNGAGDDCAVVSGQEDYVYQVVIPCTNTFTFSLCGGASWDSYMVLSTIPCPSSPFAPEVIAYSNNDCGQQSTITATLTNGSYYLIIEALDAGGAFTLDITGPNCCGGNVLYVDADATGANTGFSWTDAFTDLRSAMNFSSGCNAVQEIWVAQGTYYPTSSADRTQSFELQEGVAVYGGFDGTETALGDRADQTGITTILSGDIGISNNPFDNSYNVVEATSVNGTAVLDGFTVKDGNADTPPNSFGAALLLNSGASPSIRNCMFMNNSAFQGGAIANMGGTPKIVKCVFENNEASSNGGCIANFSGAPVVSHCIFRGNEAVFGAGIFNTSGLGFVSHSVFSGNVSTFGSGVYNNASNPTITHSTFSGNMALDKGAGVYGGNNSRPNIFSSIFWGNNSSNGSLEDAQLARDGTGKITISFSCIEGLSVFGGFGNLSMNPLFNNPITPSSVPSTAGDFHLSPCSPIVDNGSAALTPQDLGDIDQDGDVAELVELDLDGNARMAGSSVDMGPYESPYTALQLMVSATNQDACEGETIILDAQTTGGSGNYMVIWDDGTQNVGSDPMISLEATTSTTYTVTVDDGNCVNTSSLAVTVDNYLTDNASCPVCPNGTIEYAPNGTMLAGINQACSDDEFMHYYDPNSPEDLLFSIAHTPTGGNTNAFDVSIDLATTANPTSSTDFVNGIRVAEDPVAKEATFVMGRDWHINLTSGNLNGFVKVRFYYHPDELTAIFDAATQWKTANNAATMSSIVWFKTPNFDPNTDITPMGINNVLLLTPSNQGVTANGKSFVEFEMTSFSGGAAAVHVGASPAFPTELLDFTAHQEGEQVFLDWTTATETNSDYIAIERNIDGSANFTQIGTVQAQGNSTTLRHYQFIDDQPTVGTNYYRLKLVDQDGQYSYSNIVDATFFAVAQFNLYPNPTDNTFYLNLQSQETQRVKFSLFDTNGRRVIEKVWDSQGNDIQAFDLEEFPDGIYFYRIIGDAGAWDKSGEILKARR